MAIDLEEIRSDINRLDSMAGEVRDYIYAEDDMDECYDIIDAIDELQDKITELQIRQRWI